MSLSPEAVAQHTHDILAQRQHERIIRRTLTKLTIALAALQQGVLLAVGAVTEIILHQRLSWHVLLVRDLTRWDSLWILQVARHGYTDIAHTAFFPLYPMLIRLLHVVLRLPDPIAGLLLSLTCFLAALYAIGRWAEREFGMRTAQITMALVALFPTSYFLRATYTESLFLLLSILAISASRQRRFLLASVSVALATLTRNTGILLGLVLLCDYLSARGMGWRFWRRCWWARLNYEVTWLFLPIAALAGYLAWLYNHTGLTFAFTNAEVYWHRTFVPAWDTVPRAIWQLFQPSQLSLFPYHALELGSWLLLLGAIIVGIRFAKTSSHHLGLVLYITAVLWITASAPARTGTGLQHWDYLLSADRFVLVMIPVFAYLAARLRSKAAAVTALAVCGGGLVAVYGAFCVGSFIA